MLPGFCGKLSRATCTRRSSFSCADNSFSTEVFVIFSSRSQVSRRLPAESLFIPRFSGNFLATTTKQGWKEPSDAGHLHLSRGRVLSRISYMNIHRPALPPVKATTALAARLGRLFGRKLATLSTDKRARQTQIVVVVESPAKAKAIELFLGPDFLVLPCCGNVRVLAAGLGSVRPEDDYALLWEVPEAAQPHVARIMMACRSAKEIVLATNPDREGEALAWHVAQLVESGSAKDKKQKIWRLVFNEVTKKSVLFAMQAPKRIRLTLVDAHLTNCALDHLIGFSLSPLLWKQLSGCQSVGRFHLAALQLVCEREKALKEFAPRESWRVKACACFEDEDLPFLLMPCLTEGDPSDMKNCSKNLAENLTNSMLKVFTVLRGFQQRNAPEPYTTSALLEDAQNTLGFGAELTMSVAQKLYEGVDLGNGEVAGLITYPYTQEAKLLKGPAMKIRDVVAQRYGKKYVRSGAGLFESNKENTLEAHEAIIPTNIQTFPLALSQVLDKSASALYALIWKRSIECQMEPAVYKEVSIKFVTVTEPVHLQATFSQLTFHGFLAPSLDKEICCDLKALLPSKFSDKQESEGNCWEKIFALKEGDEVFIRKAEVHRHFSSRPVRYSEGQLVNAMAGGGIGRPLSYASIVKSLQAKRFVRVENQRIIPEVQGLLVTSFFSRFVSEFVDCKFIAWLGKQVDEVSSGRLPWKNVLRDFWPAFNSEVSAAMKVPNEKVVQILHEVFFGQHFQVLGFKGHICPRCGRGNMLLKKKRFGKGYDIVCDGHPLCSFKAGVISEKHADGAQDNVANQLCKEVDILLGVDPATSLEVMLRTGPWGTYLQLGNKEKGLQSFKIPHGIQRDDITLKTALALMKYPVELGKHPEDGGAVILGVNSKSSFCIRHASSVVPVSMKEDVEQMTLERALELLKQSRNASRKSAVEKRKRNRAESLRK